MKSTRQALQVPNTPRKLLDIMGGSQKSESQSFSVGNTRKSAAQFKAMFSRYQQQINRITQLQQSKKQNRLNRLDNIINNTRQINQILDSQMRGQNTKV